MTRGAWMRIWPAQPLMAAVAVRLLAAAVCLLLLLLPPASAARLYRAPAAGAARFPLASSPAGDGVALVAADPSGHLSSWGHTRRQLLVRAVLGRAQTPEGVLQVPSLGVLKAPVHPVG